jgi:predicted AAA+ superfamily ATPase
MICFGGYPGSYQFRNDKISWLSFLKESIINAVIGKDILINSRVKSPALFKQTFDLVCSYPVQEISYTKLLGQLQDKGNTDLVKHYLELFEGAFLVKQLFKYTSKAVVTKTSSPKIIPMCPALYTVTLDADVNDEELGRCFEIFIGALLLRLPGKLYYWRERNYEVDYVYKFGKKLTGIEVKKSKPRSSKGLQKFQEKYPGSEVFIATQDNYLKIYARLYALSY